MAFRTFFLTAALLIASSVMAQAYRWVDANGVVHFSDRPQPGAEEIALPEYNTFSAPRREPRARSAPEAGEETPDEDGSGQPFAYSSLEFRSPAAEETLWNIEGVLNVALDLQPGLQPGHQVKVYHNGKPQLVSGTSFQLQEVWRGEHKIQAEILDANGKMLIRSRSNRFYVQQNTIGR
jgi:hypothetical protein